MGKRGRPLKYKTVDELKDAIELYFYDCDTHTVKAFDKECGIIEIPDPEPYTVTGLALALGLTRQDLINYQGKKEYQDTIKEAKARVENYAEKSLYKLKNVTGVIFNLKNNYGWVDKQDIDMNTKIEGKLEDFF